ncbi:MarR family winged helix-turn-helix transcriptional regulator [Spongiactinospora sp. TRM90649]|uniref:MarR family winged helix-turn-helix transcriptional regulator n=1 Tax=Spongiactinospora sp. TRM90649 TaxID=3031114 RepID=UPI0023F92940|nr:MarR family winged helix-turn-helix transcriptional regulator [Spongiactinospora sp. TRM90649]MDF5752502.1 MarR family winged helix-turn-helix transcriptional regulator [Spongiactinospora sp. TRM90649]
MEPVETPCVCTTLRMTTRSVVRLYDRALSAAGLRATGYSILSRVDAEGPLTITDLAARLALDRTTCSREVEALVRTGLLTTETGSDRRRRMVRLSPQGATRLADGHAHWEAAQQRINSAFGIENTDDLLSRLRSLLRESTQAGLVPPPRADRKPRG